MRRTSIALLVLAVGCGGGSGTDGPPAGDDAPPRIDGRTDLPDAAEATCTAVSGTNIAFEELPGLNPSLNDTPLLVTSPPGDCRLFIVERNGEIQIYVDGAMLPDDFFDNNQDVSSGGESGLLGLAFHPDYANNGRFYVFYDADNGGLTEELDEYQVDPTNPNRADMTTRRRLLSIPDQASNHNGGMIEFGSDGLLYVSVGDGGPQEDPENDAQDLNIWLGKILRLDIDGTGAGPFGNYAIPSTNPYADGVDGAPEIFMYGMRNPWRWSFDRATNDMYVGDVGQGTIEEVTVLTPGQQNNADLGWRECEGTNDHIGGSGCDTQSGHRYPPQSQHTHSSGFNAIIGGQVYRGTCFPDLVGTYLYSDHGSSELWALTFSGGIASNDHFVVNTPSGPASIHADSLGELYLTTADGAGADRVFHIVAN